MELLQSVRLPVVPLAIRPAGRWTKQDSGIEGSLAVVGHEAASETDDFPIRPNVLALSLAQSLDSHGPRALRACWARWEGVSVRA